MNSGFSASMVAEAIAPQSQEITSSPSLVLNPAAAAAVSRNQNWKCHLEMQGLQMSRGFRALKAWTSIREHGALKLGAMIQKNVEQASYLAELIEAQAELEVWGPPALNVVCFRYKPAEGCEDLEALNRRVLIDLHESVLAAPSHTVLDGVFWLRVAISNHRSLREDFVILVEGVLERGRRFCRG